MFVQILESEGRSRLSSLIINLVGMALAIAISVATIPAVEAKPKFAAITVDAHNGRILFARNIDAPRYPASLAKIMTLYILFQDLEAGRIEMNSRLRVSRRAASRQPSKLGLKPGSTITVRNAIRALVTKSANDVATAVAEGLAGTETKFAVRMTRTARSLGMTRTTFANASGLPDRRQLTTARDMATLGLRIQKDFPKYYNVFKRRHFTYRGRRYANHNRLLGRLQGVDGIKTGYTRASGFNLTSSLRRRGRHVVGVVMGARSGKSRNRYMAQILKKALKKVPNRRQRLIASVVGRPPAGRTKGLVVQAVNTGMARGRTWQIQVGAFSSVKDAMTGLARARNTGLRSLKKKKALTLTVRTARGTLYRARFAGFDRRQASRTCNALARRSIGCLTIAPRG